MVLIQKLLRQTGTHRDKVATYVEIDFPEVTSKKAMSIRKSKELSNVLGNATDVHLCGFDKPPLVSFVHTQINGH